LVPILHYLAVIGAFLSAGLILPSLIGFGTGDTERAGALLIYTAFGFFLSTAILMATRGRAFSLNRIGSIYLVVIGWVIFPLVLAIPFSGLMEITYHDALFEAVSAFTTTAADGIKNPEALGSTAVLLRATIQWFGGLLTLFSFVLFLGPLRIGGMPRPRTSIGEAAGRTSSGINRMAMNISRYFLVGTIICFSLLLLCGVDAYSSLILATTAITAGGYIPPGNELVDLATTPALLVMAFFFIMASTSIFWHRMIGRRQISNLKLHRESYFLLAIAACLAFILFVAIAYATGIGAVSNTPLLVSEAIFNATSIISTSGLQSRSGIFALLAPSFVMALLVIGGGCYSTAGGVKLYRIGAMLFHSRSELSKLVYPHGVPKARFGSDTHSLELMKSIWTMFLAALITIVFSANALALTGLDFQASFTAAIAAFSNAGPAYSTDWVPRGTPGWPAYGEMVASQKLILSAVMLLGHLEVIALIVALNPFYWLKR